MNHPIVLFFLKYPFFLFWVVKHSIARMARHAAKKNLPTRNRTTQSSSLPKSVVTSRNVAVSRRPGASEKADRQLAAGVHRLMPLRCIVSSVASLLGEQKRSDNDVARGDSARWEIRFSTSSQIGIREHQMRFRLQLERVLPPKLVYLETFCAKCDQSVYGVHTHSPLIACTLTGLRPVFG